MTCSTCRNFRRGVAARLGYCALDRGGEVLTGDEVRACWQAPAVLDPEPGLFDSLMSSPAAGERRGEELGSGRAAGDREAAPGELRAAPGAVQAAPGELRAAPGDDGVSGPGPEFSVPHRQHVSFAAPTTPIGSIASLPSDAPPAPRGRLQEVLGRPASRRLMPRPQLQAPLSLSSAPRPRRPVRVLGAPSTAREGRLVEAPVVAPSCRVRSAADRIAARERRETAGFPDGVPDPAGRQGRLLLDGEGDVHLGG